MVSESSSQREPPTRPAPFRVGDWRVEPASDRVIRGKTEIKLEPRVMDLLLCFAARPGEVLTREFLEASVWSGMVVGYDALTSAMIKLRKAFSDDSRNPRIFETVAKRGYRLIAPVCPDTETPAADAAATAPKPAAFAASPAPVTTPPAAGTRKLAPVWSMAGAAVCIIALLLYLFLGRSPAPAGDTPAAAASGRPVLVVLPFVNLNDDPQQEYFSDGITDDLIIDLSRFSGLVVIARSSAFTYKSRKADIPSLARDLGVNYIVEGSVRRVADQLRVNVQLVDAATGSNIWAQRFERKFADLFSVQDDIRRSIISVMAITLTEEEQRRDQRRSTNNIEAYDYFLRGQASLIKRASATDNNQARGLLEQAIALDGNFSRAYSSLALTYADAYRFDWSNELEETRGKALEYGERAIHLDPQSPQAHWILGYIQLFLFNDQARALELGNRTLQLDPNSADGYTLLGVVNAYNNNPERARQLVERLMQINPHYPSQVPSILGLANLLLGNYQAALAAYDEALMINPARIQMNVFKTIVLNRMGRRDDAQWQAQQVLALEPEFDARRWTQHQPFSNPAIASGLLTDLQQAGL